MEKKPEAGSEPVGPFPQAARERGGPVLFSSAEQKQRGTVSITRVLWRGLKALWAPLAGERRCPACAAVYETREQARDLFCPDCSALLPRREKGYCPDCGEPAAWPELPLIPCLRCLEQPPLWSGFFFHSLHQGLLQRLLLSLKFHGHVSLAHPLGCLLARHPDLADVHVDCVVPVPLHKSRLARRGYNQALELARPLAVRLQRPCRPNLLTRVRATPPQTGGSLAVRQQNTWGAFAGSPDALGKRILLLDDTVTTGSTLRAATAALLEAGASSVRVAAVSRTARRL